MDGVPPGIALAAEDIQKELDRRRPGQSAITTPRAEKDRVEILSGVFDGLTTGTPIALLIRNEDKRSGDYDNLKEPLPARATPTGPTARSTACGTGGEAGGLPAGRPPRAWPPARSRRRSLPPAGSSILGYTPRDRRESARCAVDPAEIERNPARCPDPEAAAA